MDRCQEITAHVKMEERYQGLSLVFADDEALKEEIRNVLNEVKAETKQSPAIFEKNAIDKAQHCSICIEFHDDVHREGGEFVNMVLKKLRIDKCERDV